MSMTTAYQEWTVTPTSGRSSGIGPLAMTRCHFWLDGRSPVGLPRIPSPRTEPVRRFATAPAMGRHYEWAPAARGHGLDAVPRPGLVTEPLIAQHMRYHLDFGGAGVSGGLPVSAAISTSADTSYGGALHFFSTGAGHYRCAAEMSGEGVLLDGSFGVGQVTSGQIVLINYPVTIFGGLASFVRRLDRAAQAGNAVGFWSGLLAYVTPETGLAFVAGYSAGASVGITAYAGEYIISEFGP